MAQDHAAAKPKLSFGFKPIAKPAKTNTLKTAAFGAHDDDEEEQQDSPAPSGSGTRGRIAATPASRMERKRQEEAQQIDQSVFDYDSVYDSIKEAEKKVKAAKQQESALRKPKYIDNFLQSADLRKRDRLRAEAKMIQKERAAEGDEFADKEAFVTSAYKEQQDEITRQEEAERQKEEQERQKNKGIGTFYRDMLNETSAAREAAIAASIEKDPSKEMVEELTPDERSDASLAKQAQERGLEVELNDDNQIVDKRDLLTKGLNVVTKKRQPDSNAPRAKQEAQQSKQERERQRREEYEARMNKNDQRARQSALIEEQMLELERKRKREEEEERQKEKVNRRRNDEGAISSAKQRFLERKRKKMEETAS